MDLSRNMAAPQQEDSEKQKRAHKGHSPILTSRLEEIFTTLEHPTEIQRSEIAKELGLRPTQVQFWFQKRRLVKKYQNEKATSNELRAENERLHNENIQMKEQLKNILCITCGCRFCKTHEMEQLRLENARLKEEVLKKKAVIDGDA
ncbi:homeobox-leucine zipper protein HDG11 [Trifolium repens]|nr:homeobox-leucine zipper protein HDG11 [Trifolium repens]